MTTHKDLSQMTVQELRLELEAKDKLYYEIKHRHSEELSKVTHEQFKIVEALFLAESKLVIDQDYLMDGCKVRFVKVGLSRERSVPIVQYYKNNLSTELSSLREPIHFWQLKKWVVFTGSSTETKS